MRVENLFPKLFVFILLFSLSGCAETFRNSLLKQANQEGWTTEEQHTTLFYAYRIKFTKENSEDGYDINYAILSTEIAAKILKTRLEDLEYILDYNNKDWAKYIDEFGLRERLEREERVLKAIHGRLQLRENHSNFKEYMGESSGSRPRHLDRGYDASKVFIENVLEEYPFDSTRVQEARKNGTLKEVERVVWFSDRSLGRKEPDPNDPNDPNKYVWKPVEEGIEFISYKIMDSKKPRDNNVEYIEGTRIEIGDNNGIKRESKPALKLFIPTIGSGSVLVIDKDREGEIGYMLPDFVEKVTRVTTAHNLMDETVLSRLFPVSEQKERVQPKKPDPITVEIAPVGKNTIDVWETNADGWTVPLKYRNETKDNYRVLVKVKGSEHESFDPSKPKQIEHFVKEWSSAGNVVEYYYPKPPLDQPNFSQVTVSGKNLRAVTTAGEIIEGYIVPGPNKFVQDNPYAIVYTDGDRRWMIKDEDGDGKYEKKREVFEPINRQ